MPWTYVWTQIWTKDLNGEEIIGIFYKKLLQKKEFRTEKVIKRKCDKYILNGEAVMIHLVVELNRQKKQIQRM